MTSNRIEIESLSNGRFMVHAFRDGLTWRVWFTDSLEQAKESAQQEIDNYPHWQRVIIHVLNAEK